MAANATPYKVSPNEWYFILDGKVFGPYHNDQEAWVNFRKETGTDGNCPTCEDQP